jgi:hypothetical protein
VGVPFGSHARLILLYLQTEALRTGRREVELGGSLREWLGRIGVSVGGMTGRSVRDQAERISRCRLTFHINTGGKTSGLVNQSIVDRALFIEDGDGRQGRLTLETANPCLAPTKINPVLPAFCGASATRVALQSRHTGFRR